MYIETEVSPEHVSVLGTLHDFSNICFMDLFVQHKLELKYTCMKRRGELDLEY